MINHCFCKPNYQNVDKPSMAMGSKDEPLFGKASNCINNSILMGKIAFVASMVFLIVAACTAPSPLTILGATIGFIGLSGFTFSQIMNDGFNDKNFAIWKAFFAQPNKL